MNARNQRERRNSFDGSEFNAQHNNAPLNTTSSTAAAVTTTTATQQQQSSSHSPYFVPSRINGYPLDNSMRMVHDSTSAAMYARRNAVANIFDGLDNNELARLRTTTMVGSYNGLRI